MSKNSLKNAIKSGTLCRNCCYYISKFQLNGNLTNTGNDITLFIDDVLVPFLNATAGPLRYNYHIHHIKLHFGPDDISGSEHTINGLSFPAEVRTQNFLV